MTLEQFARGYLAKWGNVPVVISNGAGGERLQIMTTAARYQVVASGLPDTRELRCTASLREGGPGVEIYHGEMSQESCLSMATRMMAFEFAVGSMKQSEAVGGELAATIRAEIMFSERELRLHPSMKRGGR